MVDEIPMYICGGCGIALTTVTMTCLVIIYFKYIYGLKIRSRYVLTFYSLSMVLLLLILTQLIYNISTINLKSKPQISINEPAKLYPNNILDSAIKITSAAVGYLVVATMYKLAISIQYSFGDINYHEKEMRQKIFNITCVLMVIMILPELVVIYCTDWVTWRQSELLNGIIFLILTIFHSFVIFKLFRNLRKLSKDDQSAFHSERKKIIRQYIVFMVADSMRVLESFVTFKLVTNNTR